MPKSLVNMALAIIAGVVVGSASVMAAEKNSVPAVSISNSALAISSDGQTAWVANGSSVKVCREAAPNERTYSTIREVRCIYAN